MKKTPVETKAANQMPTVEPLFYRMRDLPKITGLGKSKLYYMVHSGEFPKPVELGPNAVGWRVKDVQAWADGLTQRFTD